LRVFENRVLNWWALVNTEINLRVRWVTVSFSRRTVFHEVSELVCLPTDTNN